MVRSALAVLLTIAGPMDGAQWIRVASPHFEVYTDTGEVSARRVLLRFEQARQVLSSAAELREPSRLHTRVLLFGSERDYASIRPAAMVSGFYQSGPDRDYIAILAGSEVDRIVLHEYTHSVLNHAAAPLPLWLEEGLAELYSTLSVSGNRAVAGSPAPVHIATLKRERWLTGDELAAVDHASLHYNEASKVGILYAQSWALTHMLMLGEGYRGKLPGFVDALSSGVAEDNAFMAAFGKDMNGAVRDLEGYARLGFRGVEIVAPAAEEIALSAVEVLEPAAALQSRAEILLLMGRDAEARRIYEDAVKRFPKSPAAQSGLAVIAMHNRDFATARRLFERALELGAKDGSAYFEYAMLLRETGAPADLVTENLERAIAANPAHAEAHFLLGVRATGAGRYSDAVDHLRAATEVLPRQAYFWQALSFAYHKLGRGAEARLAATRALRAAKTDHEEEMARSALQLTDDPKLETPANRPEVVTPDSWTPPKGDRTMSGELLRVDCDRGAARLLVRAGAETVTLNVADPRKVVIKGGEVRRTLSCGPQARTGVEIEFIEATRQVTSILFQ